jgi:hypothetical protein
MTISSVSSSAPSCQSDSQQSTAQQNFLALARVLQSGNLPSAQQAYAALTQNPSQGGATGSSSGQARPLQQALQNIGTALRSGDMPNRPCKAFSREGRTITGIVTPGRRVRQVPRPYQLRPPTRRQYRAAAMLWLMSPSEDGEPIFASVLCELRVDGGNV